MFAFALVELACRALPLPLSPNWEYHPALGWTQRAGEQYDYYVDGVSVHVEFNDEGFRDVARTANAAPGVRRAVVIGDSFSEALQVELEEAFPGRLERRLTAESGTPWEVINLGVGNWGTTQAWIALRDLGLRYDPDVVIVQIFPLNDVCNNSLPLLGLCRSEIDRYRPYFARTNGSLSLTWPQPVRAVLREHSRAFALIEHALVKHTAPLTRDRTERWRQARHRALGFPGDEVLLHTWVEDEAQLPAIREGWTLTEDILRLIHDTCRQRGIAVVPLVIPYEMRVDPATWHGSLPGIPEQPARRDYPERRLARFFAALDAPVVSMLPIFERNVDAVLPYPQGHLNAEGHRLVTDALYDALVARGIVGD